MTIEQILAPDVEALAPKRPSTSRLGSTKRLPTPPEGRHLHRGPVSSDSIEFEGRQAGLVLAQDVTEQRGLEEQLRQAQKMEAIGQLAGGIAHDFNNLLLVIRGYSATARRSLKDEVAPRARSQIDRAAQRAAEFTHQLLAFSRQQVLQPEVIDLNDVVAETLALFAALIGGTSSSSRTSSRRSAGARRPRPARASGLQPGDQRARRDARTAARSDRTANVEPRRGRRGRHERLSRARTSSRGHRHRDRAWTRRRSSRVFEPFFTTKEGRAPGLGLATVYGIVKQSGGHIWVYSEPGMGTTFKLYFPAHERRADAARSAAEAPESLTGSEMILLVEDAEMVRSLVTATLKSYGYTCWPRERAEASRSPTATA